MIETSSTFRPCLLSPRTAKYVAALMREGDNFDYYKWLQRVREEEAQAKQAATAFTSGEMIPAPGRQDFMAGPGAGTDDQSCASSESALAIKSRTQRESSKSST